MIIAVDFDGTCVEHAYPEVGPDVPDAVDWLRRFDTAGATLILWTMRSDGGVRGNEHPLTDARAWFAARGIPLFGVNRNPEQSGWTDSPKVFAHLYIDDAAYGCPLTSHTGRRPYVNWAVVGPDVLRMIEHSVR